MQFLETRLLSLRKLSVCMAMGGTLTALCHWQC
uniref:Uncharacterized protein n=1 Tax=Arundo donax TaxID=35708 RepID=A0A0A9EL05_ARUDO